MVEYPKQYVVDTSSLILWARHFTPFDKKGLLYKWLNQQFKSKNFILLPSVLYECRQAGKGVVVEQFDFLGKAGMAENEALEATQKQYRLLDNQWAVSNTKKRLLKIGKWEESQKGYIKSADCQMIFYTMKNNGVGIITEETHTPNDEKTFKKIPVICELQNIDCCNAVEFMLKRQDSLSIEITYERTNSTHTLTCSEDQAVWLAFPKQPEPTEPRQAQA